MAVDEESEDEDDDGYPFLCKKKGSGYATTAHRHENTPKCIDWLTSLSMSELDSIGTEAVYLANTRLLLANVEKVSLVLVDGNF